MTLLFTLMKYNRYTSHFIGSVHIFMLYTCSLYWLIRDNFIIDTLPNAYFACYRLAHDDGKCTNCMFQLLHRIDIDCFRFEYSFRLVSSFWPIWVSIRVHISLAFVVLIICLPFANYSCILVLNPDPHACRGQGIFFYNCYTCMQILLIVLNKMPSF